LFVLFLLGIALAILFLFTAWSSTPRGLNGTLSHHDNYMTYDVSVIAYGIIISKRLIGKILINREMTMGLYD
jgi:hypothetical protein